MRAAVRHAQNEVARLQAVVNHVREQADEAMREWHRRCVELGNAEEALQVARLCAMRAENNKGEA